MTHKENRDAIWVCMRQKEEENNLSRQGAKDKWRVWPGLIGRATPAECRTHIGSLRYLQGSDLLHSERTILHWTKFDIIGGLIQNKSTEAVVLQDRVYLLPQLLGLPDVFIDGDGNVVLLTRGNHLFSNFILKDAIKGNSKESQNGLIQ